MDTSPIITPKSIQFETLGQEDTQNHLFTPAPIVLCQCQNFMNPSLISINLIKEIEDPNAECFLVIDIVSQNQLPNQISELKNIKISELIPSKKLIQEPILTIDDLETYLQNIEISSVIKQHKRSEHEMEVEENPPKRQSSAKEGSSRKYGSFSIRLFPFHKSFNKITLQIPNIIQPLSEFDILSYQKSKKFSTYEYIMALPHYSENFIGHLETAFYLNWGKQIVEFWFFSDQNSSVVKVQLKPYEILIVPPLCRYRWTSSESSLTKLLTWRILPKKGLETLRENLEKTENQNQQSLKKACSYSINHILIDYCFHEFSLIQTRNQDFMYNLANYINRQYNRELNYLKEEFNVRERDIAKYIHKDKNVDECEECHSEIVNFFSVCKNLVLCVKCAGDQEKIGPFYQRIPNKVFQEGCQVIFNIFNVKQDKKAANLNVELLMKNAVFYNYEDLCDGDFLGAYNSANCKIHEGSSNKPVISRPKIVANTVERIKQNIEVQEPLKILSSYSEMKYTNKEQKEVYQQILIRTSNFIKKEEEKDWLRMIMPQYKEDDLKLFAIGLCSKESFGKTSTKME